MVSATPSPALKIRERIKKATRAFHAPARKVFLHREIDTHLRTRLFSALVVSILLYNSEIWVPTRVQVRWIHIFFLRCLRRMGRFPRAPIPGKERLSVAEVLVQMKMPSVFSLIASRRVNYAMSLCRCPLDPLLGLLSAHDTCADQWSSLVVWDPRVIGASEFGQEAYLGDPSDNWPVWVSRTIPATTSVKTRSSVETSTAQELQWHSLLNRVRVLSAANSVREGQRQSRLTQCEHMNIANECLSTLRMTALVCPGCDKHFPSRLKLLDHAEHCSKGCRDKILASQLGEA